MSTPKPTEKLGFEVAIATLPKNFTPLIHDDQLIDGERMTNLVLDQELDTLNGGSSGLGDSGGDTTH